MIYFDLDNTLIDYNSSERKAIEFIFKEKYGLVLNNNQTDYWSKISRKYFDYYLSKQITFEEQGKNRFIKMLSYCGYVENEKIAMELFEEYQKQLENSWILFDDVVDMLHSLEGYRLGIISNGKSIQQRAKLSCTNIEKYQSANVLCIIFPHMNILFQKKQDLQNLPLIFFMRRSNSQARKLIQLYMLVII